jgi:hypothetical protein
MTFSKNLPGYNAIPKPSSKRDIYTALKDYITFSKKVSTPTQSALWGVNYAHPERTLGRQYAHPDHRGVTIRYYTIVYHTQCIPTQ